jgi:predicted DNA-binding helix-hairpin-helix protein
VPVLIAPEHFTATSSVQNSTCTPSDSVPTEVGYILPPPANKTNVDAVMTICLFQNYCFIDCHMYIFRMAHNKMHTIKEVKTHMPNFPKIKYVTHKFQSDTVIYNIYK